MAVISDLSRSISRSDWARTIDICRRWPQQAQIWSKRHGVFDGKTQARVLPLHEAIVGNAPLDAIRALVQAYPEALMKVETSYGRLPLHCACRKHADPRVMEHLIRHYKDGCIAPDSLGRLPLHYALTNGANPKVVDVLIKAHPEAATSQDYKGWSPAFVAVSVGASTKVTRKILSAYPTAAVLRTNNGTPIDRLLVPHSPNRDELASLVEQARKRASKTVHLPSLQRRSLRASHLIMA